ncbi:MAG: hypothetical protein GEU86_13305 [Actinophytocola sp.]|nr:hypothetical protein [Actinophytocola sp.]
MSQPESTTKINSACRRAMCARPAIGRGLCVEHYARWQAEQDPLELPDDTAPAPEQVYWVPPRSQLTQRT